MTFNHTSKDGTLTVRADHDDYFIRDNERGTEKPMPMADLSELFPHPSMFPEDSSGIAQPPSEMIFQQPGGTEFNRQLAMRLDHDPVTFREHYFGLMQGMGLQYTLQEGENPFD